MEEDNTYTELEAIDVKTPDPPTRGEQMSPNPGSSGSQRDVNMSTPRMTKNEKILCFSPTQWAGCFIFFMILTFLFAGATGFLLYRIITIGNPVKGEQGTPEKTDQAGLPGPSVESPSPGGATYVRWGRTSCPDGVDLVYAGIAGGTYYTQPGGGANYLCLHTEPQWANYVDGSNGLQAFLHGAEYDPIDSIYPGKNLVMNNVPCAVCHTRQRSTVLMIPARRECPNSTWSLEYKGYLMTQRHDLPGRTMFECMDDDPEVIQGGASDLNGALFFAVEGVCPGSLPCPPYVNGREITCVVCSL